MVFKIKHFLIQVSSLHHKKAFLNHLNKQRCISPPVFAQEILTSLQATDTDPHILLVYSTSNDTYRQFHSNKFPILQLQLLLQHHSPQPTNWPYSQNPWPSSSTYRAVLNLLPISLFTQYGLQPINLPGQTVHLRGRIHGVFRRFEHRVRTMKEGDEFSWVFCLARPDSGVVGKGGGGRWHGE